MQLDPWVAVAYPPWGGNLAVLVASAIEKSFGDRIVLRGIDLVIEPTDRVGLVGPNGCGKSTFARIIAGMQRADHGSIQVQGRVGLLEQVPSLPGTTVQEAAEAALGWHRDLLTGYHEALARDEVEKAAVFQERLDLHGWEINHRIEALLTQLRAPPPEAYISTLSGGEQRRVALARVLLEAPELLIVDEPTNHLDAETVSWLESYLLGYRGAVLLVTHDRYLLESVAERIVEIEDGEGVAYDGSYGDYLVARAERRASLERTEDARLRLLAREAVWAARSPAARRGKQRARLQRLEDLQKTRPLMKEDSFELDFKTGLKQGGTAIEIQRLSKAFGEKSLIKDFFLSLAPGDRVGVVGPNGCGKSTLLRMLIGEEAPDEGEIFSGPRVRVAMLDQERSGLNPNHTVFEAAGGGNDHVFVADQPIHVAGFLRRFLFGRELLDQSVSKLSGGERARLLLARLLLEGANVLLLDEPTNDLDLQTLRVLEEALLGFDGVALVVTHDRALLDRTCNSVLAFEGEGMVTRYASRGQWEGALARQRAAKEEARKKKVVKRPKVQKVGLTYAEKMEYEGLPAKIEELEEEVARLEDQLANPITSRDGSGAVELNQRLKNMNGQIEQAGCLGVVETRPVDLPRVSDAGGEIAVVGMPAMDGPWVGHAGHIGEGEAQRRLPVAVVSELRQYVAQQ